ncbi:MAG: protein kinase [Vicinamibacteria bacterium]|nr:protein kinase [Vicinamibacteria bacterium]
MAPLDLRGVQGLIRTGASRRAVRIWLVLTLVLARPSTAEEWFDAYTRGVDALRNKDGRTAMGLLQRAIRLQPEPGANVITYGTNRIDYYPYLRLAEACLLAGELDLARKALDQSGRKGKEPAGQRRQVEARLADLRQQALLARVTPLPPTPAPSVAPTGTPFPTPHAVVSAAPVSGTLDLRSEPAGAMVLREGRLIGITPLTIELEPGLYKLTLRMEGFTEEIVAVRVTSGRKIVERRKLNAIDVKPTPSPSPPIHSASLFVYSIPPGALVYIDDEPMGVTDPHSGRLVKGAISPGTHRIRLTRSGYRDVIERIEVAGPGPIVFRGKLEAAWRDGAVYVTAAAVVLLLLSMLVVYYIRRRARSATANARLETPSRSAAASRSLIRWPAGSSGASNAGFNEPALFGTPPEGGEIFGEYLLFEQIGKGGMAAVYKAERHGEVVALKRPLAGLLDDQEFLQRFIREAEIGRTLHHPNIIRIFERGEALGVPFFTMELIDGENLGRRLRNQGRLDPTLSASFVYQIAEALDYAHLKEVVHRDVKPSNIMITREGTVKVMDYGIARARSFDGLTVTGAFLGTPDYVAPETAEGRGTDGRSDLYSLGVVFYEMVTGRRPFVGDTHYATLKKHCLEPPTPPSDLEPGVPEEIEAMILRLLQKDPAERYATAGELLSDLRSFLNRPA